MGIAVKRLPENGQRQVLLRANTPDYDIQDWVINPDLSGLAETDPYYWHIEVDDTIRDMTTEEKNTADLDRLELLKTARLSQVSATTQATLEVAHATFNGKQFSITHEAQNNWMAMTIAAQFDMVTYPVEVTLRDGSPYHFNTKVEFLSFGQVILGTVKYFIDIERSLINAIKAATSKPELDAIVDPRI